MWRSIFVWIALLAASVLVALLGWQNRGLRADRDWLTDRAAYAYPGMYVPVVETSALDGAKLARTGTAKLTWIDARTGALTDGGRKDTRALTDLTAPAEGDHTLIVDAPTG